MTKEQFITELSSFEGNIKAKAADIYDRLFPVVPVTHKPFNLERSLAGDKVVTGKNEPVTEVILLKTNTTGFPLVAVVNGISHNYTTDGVAGFKPSDNDLFMAATEITGWVNVYNIGSVGIQVGYRAAKTVYTTYENAISCADDDRIATVPITFSV